MLEDSLNAQKPKVILNKKPKAARAPSVPAAEESKRQEAAAPAAKPERSGSPAARPARKKVVVVKKRQPPSEEPAAKKEKAPAPERQQQQRATPAPERQQQRAATAAERQPQHEAPAPERQQQQRAAAAPERQPQRAAAAPERQPQRAATAPAAIPARPAEAQGASPAAKAQDARSADSYQSTIDILMQKRPDIKAGNLADRAKNRGAHQGGTGGNRHSSGFHDRGRGGFSGAQAREGAREGQKERQAGNRGGTAERRPGAFARGNARPLGFSGQRPAGSGFGAAAAPAPSAAARTQAGKKGFKGKKVYGRREKEESFEEKLLQQKKKQQDKINAIPKEIEIMESVSISELARKMNLKASEIIAKLMEMGMMLTVNQSVDAETAAILASEYGCDVHIVSLYDETVIESESDENAELKIRPPVVTIMGHVDHGKTKTLDAIRSSHVAEGEFGGITQHIGAYIVDTPRGRITFLDTPGHEAFTMMRARGADVTDIVVLVVAADDGVMPQTVEAINHARAADVPIIVAVNKIDKPEANPDKVKRQLSELGLAPEEWGGDTMFVHISALRKEGLDDLLEAILLQAEILELRTNYDCRAEGKVIESRIDHGRGIVATILVQRGTLRTGDAYVAGVYSGRVRAVFSDRGEKIEEATPSMPVEILGLEGMPNAGDPFQVTESERLARQISVKRQELKRFETARNVKKVTLENLYSTIDEGEISELNVIIKGDVQGSVEALKQSLEKLSTPEIRLNVIHASAGAINDSDVMLASADSNAIIIGFNVRPTPQAKILAEQEKVDIRKYNVIYKAVEEIERAMEGILKPDIKEEVIGSAEVREAIRISKVGVIAGSYVLQGAVRRSAHVNVIRDGIVVHSGKVSSLRRFKDDVREVTAGFECGIGLENYDGVQSGDQLEFIEYIEVARKLKDTVSSDSAAAQNGAQAL